MKSAAWPVLLGALVVGCGDPVLWARYRAERDFWRASRMLEGIAGDPSGASAARYDEAATALRGIVERFPPAAGWADTVPPAGEARHVAIVAGRAATALGRLEELRGRLEAAAAAYARALAGYRFLPEVSLEAALGLARALEGSGRDAEATDAWLDVARSHPLVDEHGEARHPVLEAPLRAARGLAARGDAPAAATILDEAARRLDRELERRTAAPCAADLWVALADVRAEAGDPDGSARALRRALGEPGLGDGAPRVVLLLAQRALDAGRPDSALAYASWAGREFAGRVGPEAMLVTALAWEAAGGADSALAVYEAFLGAYPGRADSAGIARYRRGTLLERLGQWERARTEFRALAAAHPAHELALRGLVRMVVHHAERGEIDLAAIEGVHALDAVDLLIGAHRDEAVQLRARWARAEILLALGEARRASEAFAALWRRAPASSLGAAAGLRAAQLAESRLDDRRWAAALYREVASGGAAAPMRHRALAELERLERRPDRER